MVKDGSPWSAAAGALRTDLEYWDPILEDYNLWRYEDGELGADSMFRNISMIERKSNKQSECRQFTLRVHA